MCACVYNIYIHIYLYTYNLCFPVECIFMRFLTRSKTNRHSISILLITYKFLNNMRSRSTCSLIGKKGVCGGECVRTRLEPCHHTCCGEGLPLVNLLAHLICFQLVFNSLHWPETLRAVYLHHESAPGFFFFFFSFKQLFETTTGILSINKLEVCCSLPQI